MGHAEFFLEILYSKLSPFISLLTWISAIYILGSPGHLGAWPAGTTLFKGQHLRAYSSRLC
jgi:hypothetical protein